MKKLSAALKKLSRWSHIGDKEKQSVCLSIIDYFDKEKDNPASIADLAEALAASGEKWSWPSAMKPLSDVVSTGGPASLTTLLCPYILAACGCFDPKVSVPGSIAGAIDVLGLLIGFKTNLDYAAMLRSMESSGIGHTLNNMLLAPADLYLFQLRDKEGKKNIPPLVIASLLSKKIAVSCRSGVVDVRCRQGGNIGSDFLSCKRNADLLVEVAARLGIVSSCVITDNSEPRIPLVGRSESLLALTIALSGQRDNPWLSNHVEVCIAIAAEAMMAAKQVSDRPRAIELANAALATGKALAVFHSHLEAQGAQIESIEQVLELYHRAPRYRLLAQRSGYVSHIDINKLSRIMTVINRPKQGQNDRLGFYCLKRKGDQVELNEPLLEFRLEPIVERKHIEALLTEAFLAFEITDHVPTPSRGEIMTIVRNFMTEECDG